MLNNLKKIALYVHGSGETGNWPGALLDYLLVKKIPDIILINFPFGKFSIKSVDLKEFKNGQTVKNTHSKIRFSTPEYWSYIKDAVYGLYYGCRYLKNTDLFFGTDNLLTVIGLFFKKIGLVKRVAYVVIDYTPQRYNNKFLDRIYYYLDKICLYQADYVLPLNAEMLQGRIRDKKLAADKINYIITPFGNHSLQRSPADYTKYNRQTLVYFGGLLKNKGVELFVPLAKSLITQGFTDLRFEVIGGGDLDYLRREVSVNNLDHIFNIHGVVAEYQEVEKILLSCGIAIAPYFPGDSNNFSYYADPGKIKFYLGCGLPIVITDVPPMARQLADRRCGLIAEYSADSFAAKIKGLIEDQENYRRFRERAIAFGQEFDWNVIFDNLMTKL